MINARDYQNDQKRDYLDLIYKEVSQALFIDTDVNYQQSALSILSELIQAKPGGKGLNGRGQNIIMVSHPNRFLQLFCF